MPGFFHSSIKEESWWWQGNHHHSPNYHLAQINQPRTSSSTGSDWQHLPEAEGEASLDPLACQQGCTQIP